MFVKEVMSLVSNKLPGFRESELRFLTFLYTCPLTTLYGMQMAGMPNRTPIEEATEITIHLVGKYSIYATQTKAAKWIY